MAVSVSILVIVIALHIIAFVFAVGAERRRSTAEVVPDQYDERTYCRYTTDASTWYGLSAFVLLLVSHAVVNGVTRCFCCGRGLVTGSSTTWAVFFFIFSWVTFLGAETCLIAGSARNAYHTKYRGLFHVEHISCATLRKGVFAAAGALTLLSMMGSVIYYWMHSKVDTGGWQRHQNEGIGMAASDMNHQQTVADILLWRNKTLTASILAGFSLIWFLFEVVELHFITVACYLLMTFMLVLFISNQGATFFKWRPITVYDVQISEATAKQMLSKMNKLITKFYRISCGEDFTRFFVALLVLWLISIFGSYSTALNVLYAGFLCMVTIPVLYERYEREVSYIATQGKGDMKRLYKQLDAKLFSKIPRGPVKGKKFM